MKNLYLVLMFPESMGLNIKHPLVFTRAAWNNTMFHVLCVMWPHVLHKWWYRVVTRVPRDGHANTKDTWWRRNTITIAQCILAWMKTLTTHEELTLILTELCFISLKEYVAHFHVNLILQEKSWHAQYALVKYKLLSITDFYTYWHHHINIRRL